LRHSRHAYYFKFLIKNQQELKLKNEFLLKNNVHNLDIFGEELNQALNELTAISEFARLARLDSARQNEKNQPLY
jgi:hypothetical protein